LSAPGMGARILVVDDSPTIRKVVAAILERRAFEPIVAEDGQDAIERLETEKVDLILLDFVMPRMNGYQFCRELRSKPEHKSLPVVLMSAKGDKIRGQFVQQTGAIDAITKPFDARGLIAVVEGALKKHEEGRARPVPDADAMPEEDSIAESLKPSSLSLSDEPGLRRIQAAFEFGAALSKVILPELAKLPDVPRVASDRFAEAIQRAVTPETLGGLSLLMKTLDFGEGTRDVLAGDISVISIAEILQLLHLQRQSGALAIFTRNHEITLYVREGNVDFATRRGLRDEFLLGRYLIEQGALSRDDLATVMSNRAGSRRLLGETLVQLGHVTEEHVSQALVRQTSELVYEVVRWKAGRFIFSVGASTPAASRAQLGLPTSALVMEGFRRVDEWRLIEGTFDFDEILFRDQVAIARIGDESKLTKMERQVLDAIDGERSVREIVDHMAGSSFEVCKILYQFLNSRLVRRKAA
jgi:CheY-like chemotaxis protein